MSGNFSRRHVLGAPNNNNNNNNYTILYYTILYYTILYYTILYYIAESPPANPRFFLEGAHGPRGRHRVLSAKPDGAPAGDPPPHGRVHTTTASPPPPPAPPKKGLRRGGLGI